MKLLLPLIVLVLIADAVSAESLVPPGADHLVPIQPDTSPSYRKLLMSKLAVTPFNCGRAILFPPFQAEGVTSVYWISENGKRTYYVTSVDAAENLWQRTDAGRYPEKAESVKIRRCDASIPEKTALLVREVWRGMLTGPQEPKPIQASPNTAEVDATTAEFWLEMDNKTSLSGELLFSLSYPGKKTKPLIDVANALYDYCKAAPEKRAQIADKIDQAATALLAQLK
jgi:hypothetical protein